MSMDASERHEYLMECFREVGSHGHNASILAEEIETFESILTKPGNKMIPGEELLTLAKGLRAVVESNLQIAAEQRVANIIAIKAEYRKRAWEGGPSVEEEKKINISLDAYLQNYL